jgi:Uma2 family endonuclease
MPQCMPEERTEAPSGTCGAPPHHRGAGYAPPMTVASSEPAPPRPSGRRVTIEEWLAIPEERRAELIHGRLVYQAMPGPAHGRAQTGVASFVRGPYDRRAGSGGGPGGWWISSEVDMEIAGPGCRPDVLGWRRDRHPRMPQPDQRGVVIDVPDWIAEVLSPSTAHVDLGPKRRAYHRAGVAHYWIVDPQNGTLTVLRWTEEDYLVVLAAGREDTVNAAPFEEIAIEVGQMLGEEAPPEETAPAADEG